MKLKLFLLRLACSVGGRAVSAGKIRPNNRAYQTVLYYKLVALQQRGQS